MGQVMCPVPAALGTLLPISGGARHLHRDPPRVPSPSLDHFDFLPQPENQFLENPVDKLLLEEMAQEGRAGCGLRGHLNAVPREAAGVRRSQGEAWCHSPSALQDCQDMTENRMNVYKAGTEAAEQVQRSPITTSVQVASDHSAVTRSRQ